MSKKKYLNIIMDPDGNPLIARYDNYKVVGGPYRETEDGIYASVKLDPQTDFYVPQKHDNQLVVFYKEHDSAESGFDVEFWDDYVESPSDSVSNVRNTRLKDWRQMWGLFVDFESRDTFFKNMTPSEQDAFIASELNDGNTYAYGASTPGYSKNERKYKHILRTDPTQPLVPLIELANLNDLATGRQCEISDVTQTVYRRTLPMRRKMQTREEVEFDIGGSRTFDGLCYISRTCLLPAKSGNLYFEYLAQFTAANLSVFMLPGQSALDISMRPFLNEIADMLKVDGANAPQSVVEMIESAALGNLNIKISDPDVCNALTLMFTKSAKFLRIYERLYTDIYGEAVERFNEIQARVTENNPAAVVSTRQYTATKKGSVAHLPNTATSLWFAISKDIERPLELDVGNYHVVTQLSAGKDYIEMAKLIVDEYIAWLLPRRVQLVEDNMSEFISAFAAWCAERGLTIEGDQKQILNPYTLVGADEGTGLSLQPPEARPRVEPTDTEDSTQLTASSTFDLSNPTDEALLADMWEKSQEYVGVTGLSDLPNDVMTAALQTLKTEAENQGLSTRKYTRGGTYKLRIKDVDALYIGINKSNLKLTLEDRESKLTRDVKQKLDAVFEEFKAWTESVKTAVESRDLQAELDALNSWISQNGYVLTNGTPEEFLGVEIESDDASAVKSEINTALLNLDAEYEDAIEADDAKRIAKVDAARSALESESRNLIAAEEVGGRTLLEAIERVESVLSESIDEFPSFDEGSVEDEFPSFDEGSVEDEFPSFDEGSVEDEFPSFGEGPVEYGTYAETDKDGILTVNWETLQDSEVDEGTASEIDRILAQLNIEELEGKVKNIFYEELDKRGLTRLKDTVHILENGDIHIGPDLDFYLEGIPTPEGLTPNERRAFVKAVKTFEEAKDTTNRWIIGEVASQLGIPEADKAAVLAYPDVPQFTVRKDYLNTYVERAQPGEEQEISRLVVDKLSEFKGNPTKDLFWDLQAYIESLFRFNPSEPRYHHLLNELVEVTNRAKLFGEGDVRRRMPLIQRTQSKAAAVYGEKGYVPVAEDPLLGLEEYAENIAKTIVRNAETDFAEFYQAYDPDMAFEFLEDRGASLADIYLGYNDLDTLPECVQNALAARHIDEPPPGAPSSKDPDVPEYAYSFEMTFGNFDRPKIIRCQDLERMVLPAENAILELVARSIFDNLKIVYEHMLLSAEIEMDMLYGDKSDINYRTGRVNEIAIDVRENFTQSDVDDLYAQLTDIFAEIITTQDPDLDLEDKDTDGEDILAMMTIPDVRDARSNPADGRPILSILSDLEAISRNDKDYEIDIDVLRSIYTECMGEDLADSLDDWDPSQYIGETKEEASWRRDLLAAYSGFDRYLPYDISIPMDDADFESMSRALQYILRDALTLYDTDLQRVEEVRKALVKMYRKILPKYFGDKTRVVHVSTNEADEFIQTHHSLMGADKGRKLNRKGLLLTIGAEVDGKLVAVATANTPTGPSKTQTRETDLSRVASDGSVKGVSSLLAGIVLQLTLDNKLSRDVSKSPLFITMSTLEEQGATYMALLNMGLRPTRLTDAATTPSGARSGGDRDMLGQRKIRWEAGEDAAPADMDIARYLQISYANRIEDDPHIEKASLLWGDSYIAACVLANIEVPGECRQYVKALKQKISSQETKGPRSTNTRNGILAYIRSIDLDKLDGRRRNNIKRYMRPFEICERITSGKYLESDKQSVYNTVKYIKTMIQNSGIPTGSCDLSKLRKTLDEFVAEFSA